MALHPDISGLTGGLQRLPLDLGRSSPGMLSNPSAPGLVGNAGLSGSSQGRGGSDFRSILLELIPLLLTGGVAGAVGGKAAAGQALTTFSGIKERRQERKEDRQESERQRSLMERLETLRQTEASKRQQVGINATTARDKLNREHATLLEEMGITAASDETDKTLEAAMDRLNKSDLNAREIVDIEHDYKKELIAIQEKTDKEAAKLEREGAKERTGMLIAGRADVAKLKAKTDKEGAEQRHQALLMQIATNIVDSSQGTFPREVDPQSRLAEINGVLELLQQMEKDGISLVASPEFFDLLKSRNITKPPPRGQLRTDESGNIIYPPAP